MQTKQMTELLTRLENNGLALDHDMIDRLMQTDDVNELVALAKEHLSPIRRLMACYRCAMMEIETKFKVLSEEFSLQHDRNPIESVRTRLKSMDSILAKLRRKDLPFTCAALEENISDVAGVRVICSFLKDVDMLAEALIQQDDVRLLEKKDYIRNPKPNGYRSLHLIVEVPIFLAEEKRAMRVEIQLRTIAMDCWASLEHQLKYKKDISCDPAIDNELCACAGISADLDARMDKLHRTMEQNEEIGGEKDA